MSEKKIQKSVKRFLDIIASLIVLIPFFPLWIGIGLIIKYTSTGPMLFLQDRPGKDKEIIKVFKFRTMKLGSEKMIKGQEVMKNDDRVTSIGKFLRRSKLDEIPQILNVLKGDMSLIGPRPERISSLEDYDDEIYKRLKMRPGMTGLAQVSGNIYLELEDRYKYDIHYVERYSLLLDIKILIRTFGVVIMGEDRYLNKKLVDLSSGSNEGVSSKKEIIAK